MTHLFFVLAKIGLFLILELFRISNSRKSSEAYNFCAVREEQLNGVQEIVFNRETSDVCDEEDDNDTMEAE